ncbi:precorrin-8X methylmutase [Gloeocapsopsis dulcis]|uniref:MerR family transcriptional regulator n=1 Tax=Gloeocapsopsis dulcis AAB1 = 1H9 TaxID=1433147 RepID=A0A6N8FRC9_9CHRO|nr:precorrin-8X methylmutase [Gloeocapsopsis dulcis]MUL34905.1 MerR family transcriptional regulator [Gloeocapsopsis dulcis AAB1 = 1H9]WNN90023.1 precorrin-8X methylmutase [Gloeocapsopsis dulcis]
MVDEYLTIKELTETVGGNMTPRMVRHYHQVGLLPQPVRSHSNYRLYTQQDVQQLRRIVALKQQGFQLSHIRQLLETDSAAEVNTLTTQLQQQYQSVMQQLARLRQTAAALEGLLGRDRACQNLQAEAIAQLRLLEVETQDGLGQLEQLWDSWDAATHNHPEAFEESLQRLLPDLSDRSEIEADLLAKLVLACGDVSLVNFVRLGNRAIAAARNALLSNCQVVGDVPAVVAALDQTRLKHLGCEVTTLIDDPHITSAAEAEQVFWHQNQHKLQQLEHGCVLVVGYAPSVLMAACDAVESGIQPALIIGMPIGFSHAPAAKRTLMRSGIPFITTEGTLGGGLLAAVALNALAESLIEKPDCHCYLQE